MTWLLTRLRDRRGFALFPTFLLLVLIASLAVTGLTLSSLDLRSTSHYRTGNQALVSAESGLIHGLSAMNTRGVQSFNLDVVQQWSTLWGASAKTMPSYSDYTYTVVVAADAANPDDRGTITATGTAPLQAQRRLRVALVRSGIGGSPGALYLASDTLSASTFNGNSFNVDGNDHNTNDSLNPSGPLMPGISTRNDSVTSQLSGSLNNQQKNNVLGLGFSSNPLTPSVMTTGGPSVADLDTMTSRILSKAGVVNISASNFNNSYNGSWGSEAAPQITHLTAADVTINGNITGAGILIVDGSLTVSGTIDFIGWIIVRGDTVIDANGYAYGIDNNDETTVQGTATIVGALWTGDMRVTVGGHANIDYCQSCMNLVDSIGGGAGNLARPMTILSASWQEL
ncbi:MAG: hypothetical protein HY699_17900 [Deltaproteobacteria bacterium]|nr:hypothetical protein [Deltaproteobacteria bacterium]